MRLARCAVLAVLMLSAVGCYTTPSGRRPGLWFAMYPINRVLDVADVVSVAAGPGLGLYGDVHATRALQVGGGGGVGILAGWWRPRECGLRTGGVTGLFLGPVGWANMDFARGGTLGLEADEYELRGWTCPSDPVFAERGMDYWAIGAKAIVGVVAAQVDIHPVEIVDAVLGIVFIDIMQDDIGNKPVPVAAPAAEEPVPTE
jgi:hypothetical protein